MSNVTIAVGTTLAVAVGTSLTDYDQADYETLTYITVGEVTGLGTFGGSSQVTTNIPLATGIVDKHIGSTDYGSMSIGLAEDVTDAGQIAMQDGYDGANRGLVHAVKLTVPTPSGGTQVRYTAGKISEYTTSIDNADSIINNATSIALTNKVLTAV